MCAWVDASCITHHARWGERIIRPCAREQGSIRRFRRWALGQLEDLAKGKGFHSLRDLALRVATVDTDKKPNYVANKVRELDRGADLTWWMGTGKAFWAALVDVLEVQESELLRLVQEAAPEGKGSDAQYVVVFDMFPGLRPLDLRNERLFPGVPEDVLENGGPRSRHTWWVAGSGAGKTLVGRWLELHFGWTFVQAADWPQALAELPQAGRVYLELASAVGAPVRPASEMHRDLRLCVACPDGPPLEGPPPVNQDGAGESPPAAAEDQKKGSHWHSLVTPPAEDWLIDLVDWVTARLRQPGGFVAREVRAMAAEGQFAWLASTPGEALDLFGVFDAVGTDPTGAYGSDPIRWVRSWIEAALERRDRTVPAGMRDHRRRSTATLVAMTKARVRDGFAPRLDRSRWVDLVPASEAVATDYAALYTLAERGDPAALDELRRRLRPDGAAWVAMFEGIRLLVEVEQGLEIRPEWISRVLEARAVDELAGELPEGLGALLLHAGTAGAALDRLVDAFASGDLAAAEVALACDSTSPEALALLDGVVRAAGLAGDTLPPDLAGRIWERALAHAHPRWTNLPPVPLLAVPAEDPWHGMTSLGAWYLAMLALSWRAGTTSRPKSALDPWAGLEQGQEQGWFLDALSRAEMAGAATRERPEHRLLTRTGRIVGKRLLDRLGVLRRHNKPDRLQAPHLVVEMVAGRDLGLSTDDVRSVITLPGGLQALRQAAEMAELNLSTVLSWCWAQWVTQGDREWPPFSWLHRAERRDDAQELWRNLPAVLVDDKVAPRITSTPAIWRALTEDVWARWLAWWAAQDSRFGEAEQVFGVLPEALAVQAVIHGHVDPYCHGIRRILWKRMPARLDALVDELVIQVPRFDPTLPEHGGPVADLVWSAPDDRLAGLVARARRWVAEPANHPGAGDWVWRWLMSVVETRKPAWREAFALLAQRSVDAHRGIESDS